MQEIDVLKRGVGINFTKEDEATINIWAPLAEKVEIEVEGEDRIGLHKSDYGYWSGSTDKIKEGTKYKIAVDDKTLLPDPTSLSQPGGVHNSSEAIDLNSFEWNNNSWNNIQLEDYIIYELHTGTFTAEGTFHAIESKLDHLKELGSTAIEIMPAAQFP